MKKIIQGLFLCIIIALILIPVNTVTEKDLHGSWVIKNIPAAEMIEQTLASGNIYCDIDDDLQMSYEFCYQEDGTVIIKVEENSARELIATMNEAMVDYLTEYAYTMLSETDGLSREEIDAALAIQGLTIGDLLTAVLEQYDTESLFSSGFPVITQYYCVKDGILGYANSSEDLEAGNFTMTVTPTVFGDTLVLSDAYDGEGNPFEGSGVIKYPLTLTGK